jgi:tetratricopeptide (TPR) repeat protein
MSDKRWFRFAIRTSLLIGVAFCAYQTVRQGIGAWYFRQKSPQAIQAAIQWDPHNPEFFDALGTLTHLYSDCANPAQIIELHKTAAQLSPENAQYWADLGAAYEAAGRTSEALRAFERAVQLFPQSPGINWKLANFYIRAGKVPEGLRTLQKVLLGDSVASQQVFALATSATRDNEAILDKVLPPRASVFVDYVQFQIQMGRMDAAEQTWGRLLQLNLAFDLRQAFPYLDGLIQHRETTALAEAWSALTSRFPDRIHPGESARDRMTNGSFEFEILNGGLDWRVTPVEGVIVSVDSLNHFDGVHSLRIEFDGTRNIAYGDVLQFALVEPSSRYELSAHMRAEGITTDSGPRMEVFDAYDMGKLFLYTPGLVGNSEWSLQHLEFETGPDTHLLIVRVARPASKKLDNRITGEVWLDQVSLVRH